MIKKKLNLFFQINLEKYHLQPTVGQVHQLSHSCQLLHIILMKNGN
jgi:hypothetical protein